MSVKNKLKVLVVFDTAGTPPADQNFSEEFKTYEWKTEAEVVRVLKKMGHEVHMVGIYEEMDILYEKIKEVGPDVIFNLMEHFAGNRRLDQAVVGLYEMMRIPYTGCGSVGLMICRNKGLSKKLLTFHRIKNPPFAVIRKRENFVVPKRIKLPCIVKMANDDASEGISQASLVETYESLKERIKFIHENFNDDALVERFIPGRELYVSAMGNKRIKVFPVREMVFKKVPNGDLAFATYKTKWDEEYRERWGIANVFADLPKEIEENIFHLCKRIYRILRIDGYVRIDLRLTPHNEIVFIEANPNPFLAPDEDFAISAKKANFEFGRLIEKIINLGLIR